MTLHSAKQFVRALSALLMTFAAASAQAQPVADPYSQTRITTYSYFGPNDGVQNGLLSQETIEPNEPRLCFNNYFRYDGQGNRHTEGSNNCGSAVGRSQFLSRALSSSYAAKTNQTITVGGVATVVNVPAGAFKTSEVNPASIGTIYGYDPRFGAVVEHVAPNVLTTRTELDDFGRKFKETRPDGTRTLVWHCIIGGGLDPSSNSVIGGVGCPAPAAGEVPADAVMYVHSEPRTAGGTGNGTKMGPFVRVYTDRLGREIRTATESFDGAGQPADRRAGVIVKDTVYNDFGVKVIETQPYFLANRSPATGGSNDHGLTLTEVDVLGRVTKIAVADPTGSQPSVLFGPYGSRRAAVQTISYSQLAVETTNDLGHTRKEEKNALGLLVRVTDASGGQLVHQHDAFGNLVATRDPLGNTIRIAYDLRGRKVQINDPDAGIVDYCLDPLGQVKAQQNAKMRAGVSAGLCPDHADTGVTATAATGWTTMAYDKIGRLTHRIEPEYETQWYYDAYYAGAACNKGKDRLCETRTSHGVWRKQVYDHLGRLVNQRTDVSGGPSFATAVAYDGATGRVGSKTYPTGVQVAYEYTALGYLEKLLLKPSSTLNPLPATPGGTPGASFNWPANKVLWQAGRVNALGRLEQQEFGGAVTGRAGFDNPTGRLSAVSAGVGPATAVLSHRYTWDSVGNLLTRADDNGDGATGAVTETFTYGDKLNRLTAYSVSAPAIPGLTRKVTLQYNVLGMLLYKSDVGNYVYGTQGAAQPHAVRHIDGAAPTTYGYDANGNLITASAGKYRTVAYTSFNLPDDGAGAQGTAGSPKYTWRYDADHARFKEVRIDASGTRTTWYLHPDNAGGLSFESETAANGTQSHRHYLSAGGQSVGVIVTQGALPALGATDTAPAALASAALSKLEYWHKDHLDSIAATSDHTGAVTQRMAFDPFGKRRFADGRYDEFGNLVIDWSDRVNHGLDRGYTGHEHLDDIGIVHMNGRLYDPHIGRFMSTDPFVSRPDVLQNYDRYSYVLNNPLNATDPTGFVHEDRGEIKTDFQSICGLGGGGCHGVTFMPKWGSSSSTNQFGTSAIDAFASSPAPTLTGSGGGAGSLPPFIGAAPFSTPALPPVSTQGAAAPGIRVPLPVAGGSGGFGGMLEGVRAILSRALGPLAVVAAAATPTTLGDGSAHVYYHGTDRSSEALLMKGLNAVVASSNTNGGGPLGFYLERRYDMAALYAEERYPGIVLGVTFTGRAHAEVLAAGARLQQVFHGRGQEPSIELFIPTSAFGVFNANLASRQIYIQPVPQPKP